MLVSFVLRGLAISDYGALIENRMNSLTLAAGAALIVMSLAMVTVLVTTYKHHPVLKTMTALAAMGYAFPGTVLAIGVVTFAGVADASLSRFANWVGWDFGGLFIGTTWPMCCV